MNGSGVEWIKRMKYEAGIQPVRRLETRCVLCLQVSTNNMPLPLSLVRVFLLTMTVAASPLGRLQLCGTELANKLAEICSAQGYNDPFRNSMYYGESHDEWCTALPRRGVRGKSHFPKAAEHMVYPRGCNKTFFFQFQNLTISNLPWHISGGQTLNFQRGLWVQSMIDFL